MHLFGKRPKPQTLEKVAMDSHSLSLGHACLGLGPCDAPLPAALLPALFL